MVQNYTDLDTSSTGITITLSEKEVVNGSFRQSKITNLRIGVLGKDLPNVLMMQPFRLKIFIIERETSLQ